MYMEQGSYLQVHTVTRLECEAGGELKYEAFPRKNALALPPESLRTFRFGMPGSVTDEAPG